jgi:hypothetical protein
VRTQVALLATRSSWRELEGAAALALRAGASRLLMSIVRPRGAAHDAFDRVVPRAGLVGPALVAAVHARAMQALAHLDALGATVNTTP